ncbi:MAG: tetratricopeptide repeat protein, partial [Cyanobacteria bacterium P01_D01_bin.128]
MNPSNVPSPSASSPTAPDPTVEFLGLNLDAFRELVTFASVAEGFTLAIAEVNFAVDGDLLIQALLAHEVTIEVQFVVLDFSEKDSFSLLAALQEELATVQLDPERQPVLIVRGLATAIGIKGDYPAFWNDLNYRRDQFARQLPYPMVLMLPDYAVNRLGQYATDLWTWTSGVFRFRTTRQVVATAQTQLRQPSDQPADSRPVKQARIEQLERLLSEAISDDELTACIPMALELGDTYCSLCEYEQARQNYHKALTWARHEKKLVKTADALYGLGQIHCLKDDSIVKALARFEQAIELYQATGARLGEANTLKAIGDVLQFQKQTTEALKNYEQAIDLYRATGARLGEANTLQAIGDVLQFQKQTTEALKNYEQAIDLYRATGDRLGEANTLQAIGD